MPAGTQVPFLPGHSMRNLAKSQHHRPQTLIYKLDCAADNLKKRGVAMDEESFRSMNATPQPEYTRQTGTMKADAKEAMRNTYRPEIQPAWLKHDRQVLRFYAYYQEPVTECATENFRVRNCTICYFLEDGTMQITEPKVENSGIWPQGPFVKRHKIPKPRDDAARDDFYVPQDLMMGKTVTIYSRAFRIINCDDFTKWFFAEAGFDVGTEEEAPLDAFLENAVFKKESAVRKTGYPAEVMYSKEYTELKLGGNRKNAKLRQFMENDRKVLRFYAYWDDPTRYGVRQYFTVHYYLADDTIEINNAYSRNSGRDPYPVFFTRGIMKKQPGIAHTPGMIEQPSTPMRPADIVVGGTMQVYGREFFIYEADEATHKFYSEYMGITFESIKVPEEEKLHITLAYPPPTGFGSDEDSLASCITLVPKPPQKDLVKLMTNSARVLRYEARPANGLPEDDARKFIIAVYLADDTVACFEVKQRNSGQMEGKFRERAHLKNVHTGEFFKPHEFFVGQNVVISSMPMLLMRADEYTLKYMEMNAETWPLSSVDAICEKLGGFDFSKVGAMLGPEQLREAVERQLGFTLIDQELITVLRYCCEEESAEIPMARLQEKMRR